MTERLLKSPIRLLLLNLIILAWVVCLILTLQDIPKQKEDFSVFILLSLIIVLLILSLIKKENKYDTFLKLLHQDCHPGDFIREARYLLRPVHNKKLQKDVNMLLLLLSSGLYAAGQFKEAKENLERIYIVNHYKNAGFIANYYHHRFLISLEIEQQDIAWGFLIMMRGALGDIKKRKMKQTFTRMYNKDIYIYNVSQDDYEGAEPMFADMFKRGRTNYERTFASFLLGEVYRHMGKIDKAKDAYRYVLKWGNKLYIAGRSAEILGLKGWDA